jgi:lambda family phage tail tape measure protein
VASNISVVLTIDNQQYIANLNKAETATEEFAKTAKDSANIADQSFNKLEGSTGALYGSLSRLKGVLAGAAFLGFARSAIMMADGIADLSAATGISADKILGFSKAVALAGGNAEAASKGLTTLLMKIDEARQGGEGAQVAFSRIGVGLEDLANLDESGLFKLTLEQLSKLPESAAKTALQGELLGKAFRGVQINQDFIDKLQMGDAEAKKLAATIENAGKLSDQWEESIGKIRLAFLEAFAPIIKGLTWMLENIPFITEAMKALAIAALAVATATGFRALVSVIGMASRGVQALLGGFEKLKSMGGVIPSLTGATQNRGIASMRDAASAIGLGAGAAVGVGSLIAGTDAETGGGGNKPPAAANSVTDAFKARKAALDDMVDAYKNANAKQLDAIDLDTQLIGTSKQYQDIEKAKAQITNRAADAIDNLKKKREALSKNELEAGLGSQIDKNIERIKEQADADLKAAETKIKANNMSQISEAVTISLRQKTLDISRAVAELNFSTATMGLGEYDRALQSVIKKERDWQDAEISRLAAEQKMTVSDFKKAYPAEVARITEQATEAINKQTTSLGNNVNKLEEIRQYTYDLSERLSQERQLRDLYDEMATSTMGELQKKYYAIDKAARESAQNRINEELKAKFGIDAVASGKVKAQDLGPERLAQIIGSATQNATKLKEVNRESFEYSRQFATGWNKAFDSYVNDATNAAKQAERLFNKTFQGIEDLLVDFVKTGKFEWKNFVSSLAEEFLRSNIKQLLGGVGKALGFGNIGGGSQGPMGTQNDPIYVTFGGAGIGGGFGGQASAFGNPFGDIGNILGMGNQRNSPLIPGGGFGGGMNQGGGFGGISNIFGGIGSKVGGIVGGISNAVGSVWDTVSGLFDGWFANGGQIGAGKFGVVGENGPELVSGPATVTPMGGGTNVTYNINAVDAQSFKQMIAADPSFIYAVTLQGAKGTPARR